MIAFLRIFFFFFKDTLPWIQQITNKSVYFMQSCELNTILNKHVVHVYQLRGSQTTMPACSLLFNANANNGHDMLLCPAAVHQT